MFETKRDVGIDTTIKGMRAAFDEAPRNRFTRELAKPNLVLDWVLSILWLLAVGALIAIILWS